MIAAPEFKCRHEELKIMREQIVYILTETNAGRGGVNEMFAFWMLYARLKTIGGNPQKAPCDRISKNN